MRDAEFFRKAGPERHSCVLPGLSRQLAANIIGLTIFEMPDFTALVAEAILAARSDAVIAADRDGIIRFWNPGAERILGFSREEVLGQSLDLIIPERLRQRHWEGYKRVMQTGQSRYRESDVLAVPALRKDGASISVEFTIVPLRERDRLIAVAAIMRDVSKRFEETRALKRKLAEAAKLSS
jgi:PAS domain S-box-containing protein